MFKTLVAALTRALPTARAIKQGCCDTCTLSVAFVRQDCRVTGEFISYHLNSSMDAVTAGLFHSAEAGNAGGVEAALRAGASVNFVDEVCAG